MKMCNRQIKLLLSALITLSCSLPLTAHAADVPQRFEFRGSGYGHGVGMSQFGAYGQALEGKSGSEIVSYYYPGTSIEAVDDSQFVRVNVADKVATLSFSVESPLGTPAPLLIYSGDLAPEQPATDAPIGQVSAGGEVIFSALSGTLLTNLLDGVTKQNTSLPMPESQVWTLRWSGTGAYPGETNIVKMRQGSVIRKYKYGQVQVRFLPPVSPAIQGSITATTTLRIHSEYLRGIGEVSSSWPSAALQAQVIAARSFALSKAATYRKSCDCNLYSSVKDQNFVGYSKESEPAWGAKWVEAVTATEPEPGKGLAVTYKGKVITTYYASSTGGTTQDVAEVWGTPTPYLVPVPDPWSLDPLINPTFSSWTRQITQQDMAKAFGLSDVLRYEITARTKAGGVKAIVAYSSAGKSSELTGEKFRSLLQLPSTWISRSVNRVAAQGADQLAIAVNRNMWPSAKSAVLVNFEKDPASALIGLSYGNRLQLPVLNISDKGLSKESANELLRRRINSVILIGKTKSLPKPGRISVGKSLLNQTRIEGRDDGEVSERVLPRLTGEPIILISSERDLMLSDAARLIASDRPLVWSKGYQLSSTLQSTLSERGVAGTFYGQAPSFRFPSRVVITRSPLAALISSIWQSPVVFADGSELENTAALLREFPNIASVTVIDKELATQPFQELS